MSGFIAISYQVRNIGKHLKFTKRKESWVFELQGKTHSIDLFMSRFSGKLKIMLNGDIKVDAKNSKSMSFPLKIGSRILHVYQLSNSHFDLRVGRISFSKLMEEKELMRGYRTARINANMTSLYDDPYNRIMNFEQIDSKNSKQSRRLRQKSDYELDMLQFDTENFPEFDKKNLYLR